MITDFRNLINIINEMSVKPHELGGFTVTPLNITGQDIDEALKISAPSKDWEHSDLQDYLTRIKTGTKTKADKFKPIIHASNIKAITKDEGGEEWDLDDLALQITRKPGAILGVNAKMSKSNALLGSNTKMEKSKKQGAISYDLTLPALNGIVVDEEASWEAGKPVFVEITTCPGAGECKTYCYAREGGYRMFPGSSMSAARALNFLVNHPKEYMEVFDSEVKRMQQRADKQDLELLVRIHDAGDFFSKEYYNLAMDVARKNPKARFYFYTKIGDLVNDPKAPKNVVGQFSSGAKASEVKKIEIMKGAGKQIKDAITVPKKDFAGLFKTAANGKYVKDNEGRTVVKSPRAWQQFKQHLASKYNVDPDTIITYDQMVKIPEGPSPKWNVVIFPAGHGDLGASRLDVQNQFLMIH
jgi:hypothetical protein